MIGAAEVSCLSPLPNETQAQQGKDGKAQLRSVTAFVKRSSTSPWSRKEAVTLAGWITLCTAPFGEAQGLSHLVAGINCS